MPGSSLYHLILFMPFVLNSVWRYFGLQLLITYGALQAVPQDQYKAARIEGASE